VAGTLDIRLRMADGADAPAVARLHADSWRRHYRGAYSDTFLDGDVEMDRLAVWSGRLGTVQDCSTTIVAESDRGDIVAFVHVIFDDDPIWGSLVENLHVTFRLKRSGIGSRLMAEAARLVVEHEVGGLYLWVLQQNLAAQRFYAALGGRQVERNFVVAPGGDPARLSGRPEKLRFAWPHPVMLRRGR
jgi:ribosomal protein S18 acetylase RimI-like enzyme